VRDRLGLGTIAALLALLAGCGDEATRSGTHVSATEQKALPVEGYQLASSICPAKYVPDRLARKWRRRAQREYAVLKGALREHPEALVSVRYRLSDDSEGRTVASEDRSVVELALEHLSVVRDLEEAEGLEGVAACRQRFRAELEELIGPAAELESDPIAGPP
jgi:hypothetical protein